MWHSAGGGCAEFPGCPRYRVAASWPHGWVRHLPWGWLVAAARVLAGSVPWRLSLRRWAGGCCAGGFVLEYVTLGWNVAGMVVLAVAARSVALAGFGLDSPSRSARRWWWWSGSCQVGAGEERQRRALRLIGYAFAALAVYLLAQSTWVLAAGYRPRHSVLGIVWTAVTAPVMLTLAAGKARTGRALGSPVLTAEGVTMADAILAGAVMAGLMLNAALGWWQADPAAGYVLVCYAARLVWGASSQPAAGGRRPRADVGGGRLVRLVVVDQRVGGVGDRVDVGVRR
jgi:hypothetical protein